MSLIATISKDKSIMNHLDALVTTWVLATAVFMHWYWYPIFMISGGMTFLYLLYYFDKYGIFSQAIRAFIKEIDIITSPAIKNNQILFKVLVNVGLLILIYVVADWINLVGIFYICLALYIAFFIIYLQCL